MIFIWSKPERFNCEASVHIDDLTHDGSSALNLRCSESISMSREEWKALMFKNKHKKQSLIEYVPAEVEGRSLENREEEKRNELVISTSHVLEKAKAEI